jgi:hypothetical protein
MTSIFCEICGQPLSEMLVEDLLSMGCHSLVCDECHVATGVGGE